MPQCTSCNTTFNTSSQEQELRQKMGLADPKQCSYCHWQNLLAFWPSVGKRYKRKCDFSNETIVTNYPKNARFPVYKADYFYSDKRTAVEQDYDHNKPLFEQLQELQEKVPRPHMLGINQENCNYCDDVRDSKNCFLSSSIANCENIFYSYRIVSCNHCIDTVYCFDTQLCYSVSYGFRIYKVFFALDVRDCSNSYFLYDCRNCQDCFMCWNLRSKQYCILNKQYTKEEYFDKLKEYDLGSRKILTQLKQEFESHIKNDAYHPCNKNVNCEKVEGNLLSNCKECLNAFMREEGENCVNVVRGLNNKHSMYCTGLLNSELCYNVNQSTECYNLKNSSYCGNCRDSNYLDNCINCSNCFACVGLKDKEYCILNKQYVKEEYEKKVPFTLPRSIAVVKGGLGVSEVYSNYSKEPPQPPLSGGSSGASLLGENDFFPYSMMYGGYNTTLAMLLLPKTKEEILKLGGYREDEEGQEFIGEKTELPDHINNTPDDISSKVIVCYKTGTVFNFVQNVVNFHKKYGLALPNTTHLERIRDNLQSFASIETFQGSCSKTLEEIIHYYPPERGYKNIVSRKWYYENVEA